MHKNTKKWILITLLLVLYLAVGMVKWRYVINLGQVEGGLLVPRSELKDILKTQSTENHFFIQVILNPKWFSIFFFGNVFLALNLAIIYVLYQKFDYIKFIFGFFFIFSISSFLILGISYLVGSYTLVAPIVARIKELQQSPFALIILIAIIELYQKEVQQKTSEI